MISENKRYINVFINAFVNDNALKIEINNNNNTLKVNTLRPRQDGRPFTDDTFKLIYLNENFRISIKSSVKFVPKGLINNIPALVLIMAWRRPDDKPLSEPMMVRSSTHICVSRPQWAKAHIPITKDSLFQGPTYTYIFKNAHTGGIYIWGYHYSDVIMSVMASQITSLTIVYYTVYSGADQRKNQGSASLAFVWGIHRWPVNSPHKGPVTRKMLPFDDVILLGTE